MSRTRHAALAATALCGLLAAGAARADVIYTFTGASSQSYPFLDGTFTPTLDLSLDITNAAVQSGAFTLSGSGFDPFNPANDYEGDTSQWTSFSGTPIEGSPLTPTKAPPTGQFRLTLDFDPTSGAVTSTNFETAWAGGIDGALNGTGSRQSYAGNWVMAE